MRYKKLGNTPEEVSVLAVGTWAIGGANWGAVDKKDSIAAIHAMLDNGVNLIDTAPGYNRGASEKVVGEALKGRRDKVYISTKTAMYNTEQGAFVKDGRKEIVYRLCEESLRNLQTDYIDLMIIHWSDIEHNAPIEETMGALKELQKAGKIRYIGLSNFSEEQIREAQKYGEITAIQPRYSMVSRESEELMKNLHSQNIANLTYGSLGAGILTGAIRSLPEFAPNDMRLLFYDYFKEPKFSKIMTLLKALDIIAENHHAPLAQVAVNWSTQQEFVTSAMCGVRNAQEAVENCEGMDWMLDESEISFINEAISSSSL